MNRIIRYLNQNKVRIIITILIIAFAIFIVKAINYILEQQNMNQSQTRKH